MDDTRELIANEGKGIVAQAHALVITDAKSYAAVGEFWQRCIARSGQAEAFLRPRITEAFQHHKNLVADLKALQQPFDFGAQISKGKMIAYDQAEKRKRELEEARLMAEQKRIDEEQTRLLAEELRKAGMEEDAKEVESLPVDVQPIVLPRETPPVQGFKYRSNWTYEIVDKMAFVKGIVDGLIPIEAFEPSPFVGQQVRSVKQALEKRWPGIRVIETKV